MSARKMLAGVAMALALHGVAVSLPAVSARVDAAEMEHVHSEVEMPPTLSVEWMVLPGRDDAGWD